MNKINFTLLLVMAALATRAQDKSDVEKEKLHGKVKSMQVTGYTVERKDGKLQKGRAIHTTSSKYNEQGNLLEFISSGGADTVQDEFVTFKPVRNTYNYDNNGILVSNCRYDGNGRLQDSANYRVDSKGNRIDWNTYKGDGSLEWNYNREFDNAGNMIETNEFYRGKLKNRHTYKYDNDGNIAEENYFDGDGRLKLKEVFTYKGSKNPAEVIDYNQNGVFQARYTYVYDSRGNQIEEREYDSENGKRFKKIVTAYDNENNVTEVHEYNEIGKLVYECKMDKLGNHTVDATYKADGKLKEKITQAYKYDDRGNQIESIRYGANGKPTMKNKYLYTYDNENNWFLKITYENDKPKRITERMVDYY